MSKPIAFYDFNEETEKYEEKPNDSDEQENNQISESENNEAKSERDV